MRAALVLCLALAACQDDNHRLEALEASQSSTATMQRELAALRAQLAALPLGVDLAPLQAQLDKLEAMVAALPPPVDTKPLEDRIAALEKAGSAAPKVPHLVVDKTGEDLGQLVAGPDVVWSVKLKGEIAVTTMTPLSFAQQQCAGATAARGVRQRALFNTPTGKVFRTDGEITQFTSESYMDNQGNCHDIHDVLQGVPVTDTGTPNPISPSEVLRLELR